MSFGSRIELSTPTLRDSQNSFLYSPNKRLEEIRKKYETPNRKDSQQIDKKLQSSSDHYRSINMTKSIESQSRDQTEYNRYTKNVVSPCYDKENYKNEEDDVFRKIKEMKESILSKKYDEKIKVTKSIYEPREIMNEKPKHSFCVEPKADNIDKINHKINHILSCFRNKENQVESTETQKQQGHKFLENSYEQREKKAINYESPSTRFTLGNESRSRQRTRSFLNSENSRGLVDKYEMRSGKKLDDEISKIDSKIQQFEEQKRSLGVEFKPYSYSSSKSVILKRSLNEQSFCAPEVKKEQEKVTNIWKVSNGVSQRNTQNLSKSNNSFEFGPNSYERSTSTKICDFGYTNDVKNSRREKDEKERNTQNDLKTRTACFKETPVKIDDRSEDIRRRGDEGIIDRRKKLAHEISSKSKVWIKKLVEKLRKQAELDEKFRNNKLWFDSCLDGTKWDQLNESLNKSNVAVEKSKLRDIFKVTDEENNPFLSVRESSGCMSSLVESYSLSENFWANEVLNCTSKEGLAQDEFTLEFLDLERKGYIVLEDIVRFINMETGTFLRNRDVYLIFKRISESEKVSFKELISVVGE